MKALKVVLIVIYLLAARILKKVWHFPAPAFEGRFLDSDRRRRMQPPDKLIERSGIRPGMTVLDLGCGSGAFTTFVARVVGDKGKVYAIDVQAEMLKQLERKLARPENRDITNVELKEASAYNLPFEDEALDLVYMVTVLQEIPDRGKALREIRRVLKAGGILAVTELLADPDYPLRSTTVKICRKEGFALDELSGNLRNYTARFKKPMSTKSQNCIPRW
jgi:ubiquinone/menaquinone biosynthesis C-methylase UbiE